MIIKMITIRQIKLLNMMYFKLYFGLSVTFSIYMPKMTLMKISDAKGKGIKCTHTHTKARESN